MSPTPASDPAIAFAARLVRRYELELAVPATTESTVAHHAIVRLELEYWRNRLGRLRLPDWEVIR